MPPEPRTDRLLASATRVRRVKAWRAVEAQHIVATLRLTGNNPVEQERLERILEESKPPMPPAAANLHYLLATPFRYPPSKHGSRFRAWPDPGVLYAAAHRRTACAELGYWRWRFLTDSPGLHEIPAAAQTLFQLGIAGRGVDLTLPPLDAWQAQWSHPRDYAATQALARQARAAGQQWIAYASVRDPQSGGCYAVLDPAALKPREPIAQETWYLTVTRTSAVWQRDRETFVFAFGPRASATEER
jgi:hypothetical protein